jgi:hypothetical protein
VIGRDRAAQRRLDDVAQRLVWLMGSPRTGSTWLMGLLVAATGGPALDEPQIGHHLVPLVPDLTGSPARTYRPEQLRLNDTRAKSAAYFFNEEFRSVWSPPLRRLVLERFAAAVGDRPGWIFVKEPNGSQAADVIFDVLPETKLIFLLRDGRDVVDSELDAAQPGAWLDAIGGGYRMDERDRHRFLEERAHRWVLRTRIVASVYDRLPADQRLLLRYEDLLAATTDNVRAVLAWLGVQPPPNLDDIIGATAFSALEKTGKGEFARAASPGLWRENFSAAESAAVTAVMAETLERFGYPA